MDFRWSEICYRNVTIFTQQVAIDFLGLVFDITHRSKINEFTAYFDEPCQMRELNEIKRATRTVIYKKLTQNHCDDSVRNENVVSEKR